MTVVQNWPLTEAALIVPYALATLAFVKPYGLAGSRIKHCVTKAWKCSARRTTSLFGPMQLGLRKSLNIWHWQTCDAWSYHLSAKVHIGSSILEKVPIIQASKHWARKQANIQCLKKSRTRMETKRPLT